MLPDERAGVGGEAVDVAVVASDVDPAPRDGGAAVDGRAGHEFPAGPAGGGLKAAEAPFRHASEKDQVTRGGEGKAVLVELGGDFEVELALLERGAVGLAGAEGPDRAEGEGEFLSGGGTPAVVVAVGRPVFAAGVSVGE